MGVCVFVSVCADEVWMELCLWYAQAVGMGPKCLCLFFGCSSSLRNLR